MAVQADQAGTQREEVMAFGLDVRVEQNLFTGYFGVLVQDRRIPVVGICYRATALDAVLLSLEGAGVVPPVALPNRHRQVGFLGARLDLVEDALPQRFQMSGRLVGVLVLGLEVGDDFGAFLVAQPFVRVDEDVAVIFASGVDAFGDRRYVPVGHAPGPIQSLKLRPEIRS